MMLSTNVTESPQLYGNAYFSAQVASNMTNENTQAKANNLSLVSLGQCEEILEAYYNTTDIIYNKIDYSSDFNLSTLNNQYVSNSVNFDIYLGSTKMPANISLCQNSSIVYSTPLKNTSAYNMTLYDSLSDSGIDIYNANSTAFQTRCVSVVDNQTAYDTTINFRRQNYYQNLTGSCSSSCSYTGLTDGTYVDCDCTGVSSDDTSASFATELLDSLPTFNIDVVTCINLIDAVTYLLFNFIDKHSV